MTPQPPITDETTPIQMADVYFNLHRGVWSCRSRKSGRVIRHSRAVVSFMPSAMIVRESGRQRVIAEGRKNVHAFARLTTGATCDNVAEWQEYAATCESFIPVSYNPYNAGHFYRKDTREPVHHVSALFMLAPVGKPPSVLALPY